FDEHLQKAGVARDDEAVRLGRMKGAGRFTGADLTLRKHPEVAEEIAHTLLSDPQGSGRRRARAAQLRGDKDLSQSSDGSVQHAFAVQLCQDGGDRGSESLERGEGPFVQLPVR